MMGDMRYWEVCRGVRDRLSDLRERKGWLSTRVEREWEMVLRHESEAACAFTLIKAREALKEGRDG